MSSGQMLILSLTTNFVTIFTHIPCSYIRYPVDFWQFMYFPTTGLQTHNQMSLIFLNAAWTVRALWKTSWAQLCLHSEPCYRFVNGMAAAWIESIAGSAKCSTKTLSQILTFLLSAVKEGLQKYCETAYSRSGVC